MLKGGLEMNYIRRAAAVWVIFILAESLNGAMRMAFLEPLLGAQHARQVGVIIGSFIIVAVASIFHDWIRAHEVYQLVYVGLLWLALTVIFEVALGRFVMAYSWDRIAADFDLPHGGLLPLGLLVLAFSPLAIDRVRLYRSTRFFRLS